MKKTIVSFLIIFCLASCSNHDDLSPSTNENNSKSEEFAKVQNAPQINSEEFTRSLLGNNYISNAGSTLSSANKEKILSNFRSVYKKAPTINGPFTAVVPVPSPPTLINQKITYLRKPGSPNYPSSAVYITDIYNYYMQIPLPSNALTGWVESVNTVAYSNYTTQEIGFNTSMATSNGQKYVTGSTFTMDIKYSLLGTTIGVIAPAPSGPKTFTYYYLTP